MKKEIIIACICAGLMLVTPLTSIAQENKVSSNLIDETVVKDDCDICPVVGVISKLVGEEDNQEVSDRFNEFLEVNGNLKLNLPNLGIKPICVILLILILRLAILEGFLLNIWDFLELLPFSILLSFYIPLYYSIVFVRYVIIGAHLWDIAVEQDCDWVFKNLPYLLDNRYI